MCAVWQNLGAPYSRFFEHTFCKSRFSVTKSFWKVFGSQIFGSLHLWFEGHAVRQISDLTCHWVGASHPGDVIISLLTTCQLKQEYAVFRELLLFFSQNQGSILSTKGARLQSFYGCRGGASLSDLVAVCQHLWKLFNSWEHVQLIITMRISYHTKLSVKMLCNHVWYPDQRADYREEKNRFCYH